MSLLKIIFSLFILTTITSIHPAYTNAAFGDCRDGGAAACTNECVPDPNNRAVQVCTPRVCAPDPPPMGVGYICVSVLGRGGGVDLGSVTDTNFSLRLPRDGALGAFVSRITNVALTFSFVILFVYLVWGSFRYLMAGGDPKAIAAAKAHLTWAIVGTIVVFLSLGLFRILNSLLSNVY